MASSSTADEAIESPRPAVNSLLRTELLLVAGRHFLYWARKHLMSCICVSAVVFQAALPAWYAVTWAARWRSLLGMGMSEPGLSTLRRAGREVWERRQSYGVLLPLPLLPLAKRAGRALALLRKHRSRFRLDLPSRCRSRARGSPAHADTLLGTTENRKWGPAFSKEQFFNTDFFFFFISSVFF